jgi:ribosomal 50S subunit-associated protein YjgA (DUF615 family)
MGWVGARSARAISYKPKTNNNDYKAREAEFVGSVLTQITINKVQDVLAQITIDNYFLLKDKDK